jgi:hypothetical protein
MGYRVVMTTHDEIVVLIPNAVEAADAHCAICAAEMKREPTWLPGIPLDCEFSLGGRYAK